MGLDVCGGGRQSAYHDITPPLMPLHLGAVQPHIDVRDGMAWSGGKWGRITGHLGVGGGTCGQ